MSSSQEFFDAEKVHIEAYRKFTSLRKEYQLSKVGEAEFIQALNELHKADKVFNKACEGLVIL